METPTSASSEEPGDSMDDSEFLRIPGTIPDIPEIPKNELPKLRSYQQEMLDESLKRNVIVTMETGSGKTLIAIFRILAELETCDPSKLIWFMTPSVALSNQQHLAISTHLPAYLTKTLLGRDELDKWTDQHLWDAALLNVRVVVGTPAVLADALSHGFVRMSRLALMVFDEAHRCIKQGPMNVIMTQFYHPEKRLGHPVPHILGLTASPVMGANPDDLQSIEANLDAQAITPRVYRPDLELYVHPPEVGIVLCNSAVQDMALAPPLLAALHETVESYNINDDPRYHPRRSIGGEALPDKLESLSLQPKKSRCYKQLIDLRQRSNALWEQVGAIAADWYIQTCIDRYFRSVIADNLLLPDLSEQESRYLASIFKSILKATPACPPPPGPIHSQLTEKTGLLIEGLTKFAAHSTRCIVFVEQRAVVHTLAHVLRQQSRITENYSIGTFVGQSGIRKNTVADLSAYRDQAEDLTDFREGKTNLMITTDVLEEGIDVTACNLVICFDPPQNLVSYVQRRGRARQKNSKYIIVLRENEYSFDPARWHDLEVQMKKQYMDEQRELAVAAIDHEPGKEKLRYQVEGTGAVITVDNAKQHLYHFCSASTRQKSRYCNLRPSFDINPTGNGEGFTARVQLPNFVHPDLRTAHSSRSWRGWKTAVKDAAFQAYVKLHKHGLLNDSLLPLIVDNRPDEDAIHLEQAREFYIAERLSPWKETFGKNAYESTSWHGASLTITHGQNEIVSVLLWLPTALPTTLSFPLYWNDNTVYIVSIQPNDTLLSPTDRDANNDVRQFTRLVFQSIYRERMRGDKADDFPILFASREGVHSDSIRGRREASVLLEGKQLEPGIIRVKNKIGQRLIFVAMAPAALTTESMIGPGMIVKRFPKRRDFLHRIPAYNQRNSAYTAMRKVPVANCTVDALPIKYSLLAVFIPSTIHRLEVVFVAQHLQQTILHDIEIQDVNLICEALSSLSSGEAQDYNRLEFLGDTVLKFCAVLQVVAEHPYWPEHYLTLEKFRLVTNNFLTREALKIGLDKYILLKQFTGSKWRPTYVSELLAADSEERMTNSKTLADVVEALIGAAYVDGGIQKGWKCISTVLKCETWYAHPYAISLLLNDLEPCQHSNLDLLEQLVGHKFKRPSLLIEAMTHNTFPQTGNGFSYERLEFIGDAVLDMIVVPYLFRHPRKLKDWQLEKIKSALVSSKFLGYCCMSYGIEEDRYDVVKQPEVDNSDNFGVQKSKRRVHLHDFLRCDGRIMTFKQQTIRRFNTLQPAIDEGLEHGSKYPWLEFIALKPLKVISDLVESVLGAIYLDTKGDFAQCEVFVEKLGLLKHMRRIMDDDVEVAFPKEQLGTLGKGQTISYVSSRREDEDGNRIWDCVVLVNERETAEVKGHVGQFEAEATAAWEAIKVLEERRERTGSVRHSDDMEDEEEEGEEAVKEEKEEDDDDDDFDFDDVNDNGWSDTCDE